MAIKNKKGYYYVIYRETGKKSPTEKYMGKGETGLSKARLFEQSLGLREYNKPSKVGPFFVELANAYITHKKKDGKKRNVEKLKNRINNQIVANIGSDILVSEMTEERINKFYIDRVETVKKTTLKRDIGTIKSILNWSVQKTFISTNPIKDFKIPGGLAERVSPPTREEILAILAHSTPMISRAIILHYYLGIRPGSELYQLTWDSWDCTSKTVTVISAEKGGHALRSIPVSDQLNDKMRSWYYDDIDNDIPDTAPIVRNQRGGTYHSYGKQIRLTIRNAGITRKIRPYDFRHAFATNMLKRGGDLKTVSKLLGHKRIETTIKHYQHIDNEMAHQVIQLLPNILD